MMNPRNPRTDRRTQVAGEPPELETLCRLHLSVLRAERAGSGQHPRRGQKCPPGLTFCLPVGKIVSYPLDNPLLLNGTMHM